MSDNRIQRVSVSLLRLKWARWMYAFVRHAAVWRRAMILVVLCIVLAGIASSSELHDALLQLFAETQEVIERHPTLGPALFMATAAISAMVTFVSIAVVVPAAVFAWGEPATLLLLWLGWILGGAGTYVIGRFLGRPVMRWLTAGDKLDHLELRLQRNAPFWLVLLVQLALPSEIPGYVLGLARYSFARYLTALGLAELPYSVATVHLGQSFLQQRAGLVLIIGLAVACFSLGAFYVLRRTLQRSIEPAGSVEATVISPDGLR